MIQLRVSPNWVNISGVSMERITDLVASAPEPPFRMNGDTNYLKANPANLLWLEQQYPGAECWSDPHNKLFEAKAYRFLSRLRDTPITPEALDFPFKLKP